MFNTYRMEDDIQYSEVAKEITDFVSKNTGCDVPNDSISWEACVDGFSLYSIILETKESVIGIIVRKIGRELEIVNVMA